MLNAIAALFGRNSLILVEVVPRDQAGMGGIGVLIWL
jgi:hypothetical protein